MLTDTQCRNAKPKERPYKLSDRGGLYLEVKPNRTKAWRYRFELVVDGVRKESVFAIGDYAITPAGETEGEAKVRRAGRLFTLAEAREERAKARALVKQGTNPAHARQLDRAKRAQEMATTFEAVAKEWLSLRDWEEFTKYRRLGMFERVVFPAIGGLPIRDVTSAQVLDVLKRAETENGPTVALEAKRSMSSVFEHAVSTLRADVDPVYPVRKAIARNKTQHKRPLTTNEIGEFLRALDGYEHNFQTASAFKLLWLTLCRPNEIVGARWEHIDLDAATWRIPAAQMKMRRDHAIPLPTQAIALLRAMHAQTGHNVHVFPRRNDRTKPMDADRLRQAVEPLGWAGRYSPHATRTTGSTRLNEIGFNADWIERQLAHVEANVVRSTYNHADYLEQRRTMMQRWADLLDEWKDGRTVVAFRKAVG